jgi:hypothetical protein
MCCVWSFERCCAAANDPASIDTAFVIYLEDNTAEERPVGLCGASAHVAYVPCTP